VLDRNGVVGILLYWTLVGGTALSLLGRLDIRVVLVALAPLALLLWFKEPIQQRLRGRPVGPIGDIVVTGFFELFETVLGYASNSLSFVRLGAFAVAHEGLSTMVLRYSGGPAGWLVLVVGTALIVGFEGLVVGIQALRLEYFEFFGRFFRGDGTPFVPLTFKGGRDARMHA
jgi:V/A-type H+-transporting ATPase subunit I